jgi:hypothetical protein
LARKKRIIELDGSTGLMRFQSSDLKEIVDAVEESIHTDNTVGFTVVVTFSSCKVRHIFEMCKIT